MPDEKSVEGASQILALAQRAGPRDLVICLISGGGSALMVAPVDGVSLTGLSVAARAAVRRRRLLGGLAAALVLVALIVLVWPVGVLTKDDEEPARRTSSGQPRLVGQTVLRPVEGNKKGGGVAVVAERGNQRQLIIQAQLPPSPRRTAYEVWLYNSDGDAQSIGAQVTDKQGRYQGAGPLPRDFDKFKSIDISLEPINRNAKHSGQSILRGPTAPLKGGPQPQVPGQGTQQQPQR